MALATARVAVTAIAADASATDTTTEENTGTSGIVTGNLGSDNCGERSFTNDAAYGITSTGSLRDTQQGGGIPSGIFGRFRKHNRGGRNGGGSVWRTFYSLCSDVCSHQTTLAQGDDGYSVVSGLDGLSSIHFTSFTRDGYVSFNNYFSALDLHEIEII